MKVNNGVWKEEKREKGGGREGKREGFFLAILPPHFSENSGSNIRLWSVG